MSEVLRRVILISALCLAVGLLRTAEFGTYYEIRKIEESTLKDSVRREWSMEKAEKLRLLALPFQELLANRVSTPLQLFDGSEWQSFFTKLEEGFESGRIPDNWKAGAEIFISNLSTLWLPAADSQLSNLSPSLFSETTTQVPIALSSNPGSVYSLRLSKITHADYQGFSGFTTSTPPTEMLYPYRMQAILIAIVGLLLYLFIPWAKPAPESVYTKRWQVMMLDFASLLLFLPFFALGSFMAGPIPIGVNAGWVVAGALWLMSICGLFLFKQGIFYALFFMKIEEDGLRVRSYQGELKLPYTDIEKVQGATLKNPRWLITLLSIAAIFGKGSQSALAGGQALMLGSSSYPGLAFTLKKGGTIYLWSSGQSETMSTYQHIDSFKAGLEKAGVPFEEKSLEIHGLGTEPRFDKAVNIDTSFIARHPLLLLLAAPVASTILIYVIANFLS